LNSPIILMKKCERLSNFTAMQSSISNYTGSSYRGINELLRNLAKKFDTDDNQNGFSSSEETYLEHIININEALTYVKPLEEPMWVMRTVGFHPNLSSWAHKDEYLSMMEVPKEYVEPGITSTTLSDNMNFSTPNDGHFFKKFIYLPAGSRVLPALTDDYSGHTNESEIILPPFSVFNIFKTEEYNLTTQYQNDKLFGRSVFMIYSGTAATDFFKKYMKNMGVNVNDSSSLKAMKRRVEKMTMIESKKITSKYNAKDKYGANVDKELSDKITKMIRDKKLTKTGIVKNKKKS